MKARHCKFIFNVKTIFPWLVWAVLTIVMLTNAGRLQNIYKGTSLRYNEPLQSDAAFYARRFSAQNKEEAGCWPTYWRQTNEIMQSEYAKQEGICLWYSGDGALVYPAKFIVGGWAGELSEKELYISTAMAWALWGSNDVCGLTVNVEKEQYMVNGIFEDDEPMAIISLGDTAHAKGWQGAELTGGLYYKQKKLVQNYIASSGLGAADTVLYGGLVKNLSMLLAVLPTVLLLVFILAALFKSTFGARNSRRFIIVFLLALITAFLLPAFLEVFPETMLPGKWSDFGFWSALIQQKLDEVKQWLLMCPFLKDYRAKLLLIFQICIAFAAIANAAILGIRLFEQMGLNSGQYT